MKNSKCIKELTASKLFKIYGGESSETTDTTDTTSTTTTTPPETTSTPVVNVGNTIVDDLNGLIR
ncbi:hypothetical protein [Kordia jejudonensis]|uniref:hypothetical protein n=1 Tax=Kordia jejudonensis TaxID=1348245 RepID=UPI00138E30A9|nr:hypothetical protein [Kordia jejudonensis]